MRVEVKIEIYGRLKSTVTSFVDSSARRATITFSTASASPVLEAVDRVHCTSQRTLSHRRLLS